MLSLRPDVPPSVACTLLLLVAYKVNKWLALSLFVASVSYALVVLGASSLATLSYKMLYDPLYDHVRLRVMATALATWLFGLLLAMLRKWKPAQVAKIIAYALVGTSIVPTVWRLLNRPPPTQQTGLPQ